MTGAASSGAARAGVPPRVSLDLAAERLDVAAATLRSWLPPEDGGYVAHELEWLRAACELAGADLPVRRIRRALEGLRARATGDREPVRELGRVELGRVGSSLVVLEPEGAWSAESGQQLLPLESAPEGSTTASTEPPSPPSGVGAVVVDFGEARRRREADRRNAEARAGLEGVATPPVADLYLAAGETSEAEEAIALLREVVARDEEHVEARLDLGALLHERGELTEAEGCYREALRLAPENATAWFDLGVALEDREDDRGAIDAYRRSLELDDSDADAWFNASRVLERLGDRAGAIAHLTRCRKLRTEPEP